MKMLILTTHSYTYTYTRAPMARSYIAQDVVATMMAGIGKKSNWYREKDSTSEKI